MRTRSRTAHDMNGVLSARLRTGHGRNLPLPATLGCDRLRNRGEAALTVTHRHSTASSIRTTFSSSSKCSGVPCPPWPAYMKRPGIALPKAVRQGESFWPGMIALSSGKTTCRPCRVVHTYAIACMDGRAPNTGTAGRECAHRDIYARSVQRLRVRRLRLRAPRVDEFSERHLWHRARAARDEHKRRPSMGWLSTGSHHLCSHAMHLCQLVVRARWALLGICLTTAAKLSFNVRFARLRCMALQS
jgi:hypothetical protein